jgi:FKBP-type peptidyl-prolyl cis-trans isomerase FklB
MTMQRLILTLIVSSCMGITPVQATDFQADQTLEKGRVFLEENAKKPGIIRLNSGVEYQVIEAGDQAGTPPGPTDYVKVHYRGTFIDGTEFDSSYARNQPATFAVNAVIPGWTEVLQLMHPHAKWMVYIPSELAYGAQGAGSVIPPNSTLIFEIELLSVKTGLEENSNDSIPSPESPEEEG